MLQPQVLRMMHAQHGAFLFTGPVEHAAEAGAADAIPTAGHLQRARDPVVPSRQVGDGALAVGFGGVDAGLHCRGVIRGVVGFCTEIPHRIEDLRTGPWSAAQKASRRVGEHGCALSLAALR